MTSPPVTEQRPVSSRAASRGVQLIRPVLLLLVIAAGLSTSTGCVGLANVSVGPAGIPIPVSPYFQRQEELEFEDHERYDTVPVLSPMTAGGPAVALDPPSDHEVMRALEKARPVSGGVPFLHEKQRNNVRIIKEKIADYVDPPRFYPLIGPAQLHHAHYRCKIYFSERTIIGWPIPHSLEDNEAMEVIYIDHNHFHMVGNVDDDIGAKL
ncbi:MAG: hypothetical protein AAFP90_20780 [Planctomycetota bacterium]